MNRRVLIVDPDLDSQNFISRLIAPVCKIAKAGSATEALKLLDHVEDMAVILCVYEMPEMDGIAFFSKVAENYSETVRVLLTTTVSSDVAVKAVNEGSIFRIISKPLNRTEVIQAVMDGIERYNKDNMERVMLNETFQASIKVLIELLGMADPVSHSRANRMYRTVHEIGRELQLDNRWDFEIATLLSQIGCVSLPDTLIKDSMYGLEGMSDAEYKQFTSHAALGASVINSIPRLEIVSAIIKNQFTKIVIDKDLFENGELKPEDIGAHLLSIAFHYDVERVSNKRHDDIIQSMQADPQRFFPPFVEALHSTVHYQIGGTARRINLEQLTTEMVLAEDVRTENDVLVVTQGLTVNPAMIKRIYAFHESHGIRLPLLVYVNE